MVTPSAEWTKRSRDLSQLLARTSLGDQVAFATLYERTSSHLLAVVLRINRDRGQAEDVLQEAYINVWRAAKNFDAAQSQPLTWLSSIARHRAIDSLRRAQAQPQVQSLAQGIGASTDSTGDEMDDVYDGIADTAPSPLDLLCRASDARTLLECMNGLSAMQRQSVALAFFHGLSHPEIAEQLRYPLGTVKSWVRRALISLRASLQAAAQNDNPSRMT